MAISFSRPDPSSPTAVAAAAFSTSRKGFEPAEVREFLRMVAAELARLQEREKFLERELRGAQRGAPAGAIALDEELVTKMLGEEAARILSTAREAASQIKIRAEEGAARLLGDATSEAQRLREDAELEASRRRSDATADAEAELEMAKQQGREMVNEARAYRERVLGELARRRELARQQIEGLVLGRDKLLHAFDRARIVAVEVIDELTPLGTPAEYVDLSPTTGPVPVMVPGSPRPAPSLDATAAIEKVLADDLLAMDDLEADAPALTEPTVVEPAPADEAVVADVIVEETLVDEMPVESSPADELVDDAPAEDEMTELAELADDLAGIDDAPLEMVAEVEVVLAAEVDGEDDTVVRIDVNSLRDIDGAVTQLAAHRGDYDPDDQDDDRHGNAGQHADGPPPANVVSLFGTPPSVSAPAGTDAPRSSVDDLFARLRASRSADVAQRVAGEAAPVSTEPIDTDADDTAAADSAAVDAAGADSPPDDTALQAGPASVPVEDSVFLPSPAAPVAVHQTDDSPFARRDEALTPIIVAAARKLKRVLADEQNEVLHTLRRKEPVRSLDAMLPPEADQSARYGASVEAELLDAAVSGAASMDKTGATVRKNLEKAHATAPALDTLGMELVRPLRERLDRCVADADGDNGELATLVRAVYREWKNQRIDEHLDDVARMAFGRGALAAVKQGAPICWIVDPNGPACPDAEDNSLGGVIEAGSPFPTDDVCAPAHSGCRCMIAPAPK